MSVVLDSCAIVFLALAQKDAKTPVGDALEREVCYMSPVTVAEAYEFVYNHAGKQHADFWFHFITAHHNDDIRVDYKIDKALVELAGEALLYGVPESVAFTAALARKRKARVLTSRDCYYEDLRKAGFCEVEYF